MSEERNYVELDKRFAEWLDKKERPDNDCYPAFYGGNTLEEDESYTFYLKEGEQTQEIEKEILEMIPDAGFKKVKHSYQELYDYYTYLNQSDVCEKGASGYYIDDERNAVVIMAREDPQKFEEAFLKTFRQEPFLIFEEDDGVREEVKVGARVRGVFLSGMMADSSMGFPAREQVSGREGFVTTQHREDIVGGQFLDPADPENPIGLAISAVHAGKVDACFAENQNGHSVDKCSAHGWTRIIGYYSPKFLKVPVAKHGFASGKTYGKILAMHYVNHGIEDQYKANYASASGDSGGAVTCCGFVIGIHTAGGWNRRGDHRSAVCKYCNIRDVLRIDGI